MIGIVVLGSTGSIGESTLDVVARHADRFRVVALAACRSVEKMAAQCERFAPAFALLTDPVAAAVLRERLAGSGSRTQVLEGESALEDLARHPDAQFVMAAIVGAAGLRSTLAAAEAGKRLLVANKESLVMAGALVLAAAKRSGAEIVPIDSEHNAIFQCLPPRAVDGCAATGVRRLILTASGGPFLDWPEGRLRQATPEQACAHPNWVMGRKISVDSATMMNKGLELIEACTLFGLPPERIEILIHPQSVIHSMVEYLDGSVLAQLGSPDMRTPIAQALAWPQRMVAGVQSLDFVALGRLDFRRPDPQRFPSLRLAPAAIRAGGLMPTVLNAANEVAVQAFLDRRLNFQDISAVTETVMDNTRGSAASELEAVLAADAAARALACEVIASRPHVRSVGA